MATLLVFTGVMYLGVGICAHGPFLPTELYMPLEIISPIPERLVDFLYFRRNRRGGNPDATYQIGRRFPRRANYRIGPR